MLDLFGRFTAEGAEGAEVDATGGGAGRGLGAALGARVGIDTLEVWGVGLRVWEVDDVHELARSL